MSPPAGHLRSIVDLAVTLLPAAMTAARRDHPGRTALLRLTDAAEDGEWRMLLSDRGGDPDARPAVVIHTDLAGFCQLVASRRTRHDLEISVTGDRRLAVDLLEVAVTLGCDWQ